MANEKIFGDNVIYVNGGSRLNAIVLQSVLRTVDGNEEQHLTLAVVNPQVAAARVLSSTQMDQAFTRVFDARPAELTKDIDGNYGRGWLESAEASENEDVLEDGPLLQDLVHVINAGNPVDAQGHFVKDTDQFKAAAKKASVDITPYNEGDVKAQIVREIQHEGIKPASPQGAVAPAQPVASPEVLQESEQGGTGVTQPQSSNSDPNVSPVEEDALVGGNEDVTEHSEEREAAFVDPNDLDSAAFNKVPETHPEYGEQNGEQENQ